MKLISIITIFLTISLNAVANDKYCLQAFDNAASKLDEVYKTTNGPFLGDLAFPKLLWSSDLKNNPDDKKYYARTVKIAHQNQSGQSWFADYRIILEKDSCKLHNFAFLGTTQKKACLNLHVAKDKLKKYLEPQLNTIPLKDFDWLDKDNNDSVLNSTKIAKALENLHMSPISGDYSTGDVFTQYCAPAAECWGWYEVSCDGKVTADWDGE